MSSINRELLQAVKYLLSFAPNDVPKGLYPTSYYSLTYEGDVKIQHQIDGIKNLINRLENDEN